MFARPRSMDEALALMAEAQWSILAGGTDFYPALRDKAVTSPVMDISAISQWRQIDEQETYWRIGALTTWTDLIEHPLPPAFAALKLAAREVGSVQIQNRATVVGNLCNASPAADGVPPLLVIDAHVELVSTRGSRQLALSEFIKGNRATALAPDELLTAILIPKHATAGHSVFAKLGARKYLVISIAMVAVRINIDSAEQVSEAMLAVGACSQVAQRLETLEQRLIGMSINQPLPPVISSDVQSLVPIDDIRAPASYRLDAVPALLDRALIQAQQAFVAQR